MVTKLVILLVIVLGVVALAQLMRVYELSSKLTKKVESDISNRDNRFNAKMMMAFMVLLFGGFIWLMLKYGWTGRGIAASVHGRETDWLMDLNLIIIIAVFFLTNDEDLKGLKIKDGKLGDIAPTILSVMKVDAPIEMDGEVLLG